MPTAMLPPRQRSTPKPASQGKTPRAAEPCSLGRGIGVVYCVAGTASSVQTVPASEGGRQLRAFLRSWDVHSHAAGRVPVPVAGLRLVADPCARAEIVEVASRHGQVTVWLISPD